MALSRMLPTSMGTLTAVIGQGSVTTLGNGSVRPGAGNPAAKKALSPDRRRTAVVDAARARGGVVPGRGARFRVVLPLAPDATG